MTGNPEIWYIKLSVEISPTNFYTNGGSLELFLDIDDNDNDNDADNGL